MNTEESSEGSQIVVTPDIDQSLDVVTKGCTFVDGRTLATAGAVMDWESNWVSIFRLCHRHIHSHNGRTPAAGRSRRQAPA